MSTLTTIHPRHALFGADVATPHLPVCDHYAGVEARMRKSLALQAEMAEAAGRADAIEHAVRRTFARAGTAHHKRPLPATGDGHLQTGRESGG